MAGKKLLFFICLAIAGLTPLIYFSLSRQWLLGTSTFICVGSIIYGHRSSKSIIVHISLAGFSIIDALGVKLDIPLLAMVVSLIAALASWDLALEMQLEYPATKKYERQHLQYLGIALGFGLLGVGSLHWFHIKLPFGVMLMLGVIMVVLINQFLSHIQKSTRGRS